MYCHRATADANQQLRSGSHAEERKLFPRRVAVTMHATAVAEQRPFARDDGERIRGAVPGRLFESARRFANRRPATQAADFVPCRPAESAET